MSKIAGLAGANGTLIGAAAVVAVGAIGAAFWVNANSESQTPEAVVEAAVTPEAAPAPQEPAAQPESTEIAPPSIDEVRLEPDGLTIIAGRAAPGSEVSVLLDGNSKASVTTDPAGSFAAITLLPPSPKAQVLTVVQRVGMDETASLDEVILAPVAPPSQVAQSDAPSVTEDTAETGSVDVAVAVAPAASQIPTDDVTATAAALPDTSTPSAPMPQSDDTPTRADVVASAQEETPQNTATPPAATPSVAEVPALADDNTGENAVEAPDVVAIAQEPQAEEAPSAVTILKSTPEGVEVLNTSAPEALDNIELDSISYSATGDVQLAGRAQSEGDAVRVYVNNRPVADLDVDENGDWSGSLPQIDTGVYTLRVDELDAAGDVTSRVETPFRREDPAVLAQSDTSAAATRITVQAGNTLWAIARDRYGEGLLYLQVYAANGDRIRDPDLIYPGQVFVLPN